MSSQKLGIIAIVTFLLVILNGHWGLTLNSVGMKIGERGTIGHELSSHQVLAQNSEDPKIKVEQLFEEGRHQYHSGQFEAALKSWQEALELYRQLKDRQSEGEILNNLGLVYRNLGDVNKAVEYHEQSLAIARELKSRQLESNALNSLGNANFSFGKFDRAIEFFQQSLTIAKELKNRDSEGITLGNLGNCYLYLADFTKAIEFYQESLEIAREVQNVYAEGNALGNLGTAYNSLGQYDKSIEYQEQSLALARKINDPQGEGQALVNLGLSYLYLGNYPKSIEYQEQSLVISRELKDIRTEGLALGNLSSAYYAMGNYAKAIEYQEESVEISRKVQDLQGEGQSLGNLGNIYYSLGSYEKAIEFYQKQLAIVAQTGDRQGKANALGNLGNVYNDLGEYNKALDFFQQSLAIVREIKDRNGEGANLGNMGLVYLMLGDYEKGIELCEQSLAINRETKDRVGEANNLSNLGLAYNALGNYNKAIEYQKQHLEITREIKYRWGESTALNSLGAAYRNQGNLAEAEKNFLASIEVKESLRAGLDDTAKVSIFETQTDAYQNLQETLIAQKKFNGALEIAERGRSRAFVELLAQRLSHKSEDRIEIAPPTIEQIKQTAKNHNATLVEYSIIYDKLLLIWVIQPTGEIEFRQVDMTRLFEKDIKELSDIVAKTRQFIGVKDRGLGIVPASIRIDRTNRLKQLDELLIKPIADLLPKNPEARVIFIPQGSLFLVPFSALRDSEDRYLIEKHTIMTIPAIQVLDLTQEQKQRLSYGNGRIEGSSILVVGNPTMPSISVDVGEPPEQLASLPGAEAEAIAIAKLFNTEAITGNGATKKALIPKIQESRIVHLATHGLLDDFTGTGIPGAIALAPDGNDNGLLTASEILDLRLKAELVVLSACDTGRGKITGDGVIGLSRSLISAGAPSIVVSLWAVPDAPTAALMTEFYRNLQKNQDKAAALRNAILTTRQQYRDPIDWAAFTLVGEAE
ncbi:MAG TPA: Fis family transcriptional regulator [Cyanobacteria bacterium UBA11149]|nr:Fis family transcriptional regulator [Cyanobacteria bacterium UBA11367]HBE56117.1 Fis family transcriptional regulator [Cyanobacteria bacterium UBA11366]HBK64792.1 Fis family transcriptional regulator [Cyanobacteria bacterium UBA11166]HBR76006.1 Fis family transcriptional regulator [Cyanobacteria bacterium UBA11159]HBS72117.1 Fis family transcriptional regulator [Cyanobacteria bacterium UBA11153]HBW87526.1 Fis family transcriptional regulator [Cyanobacteria bacterium UBA11149]HCA96262.1 Fi